MEQQPSDQTLLESLRIADGAEPTEAKLDAAAELESRRARILDLYEEADRLQEDDTPIDIEEYNRLIQVLPTELRDIDLSSDPKVLDNIRKSFLKAKMVEKYRAAKVTDDTAKAREVAAKAKEDDKIRLSELEKEVEALRDHVKALQDQLAGTAAQADPQAQQNEQDGDEATKSRS
jgi:hypothetical protein